MRIDTLATVVRDKAMEVRKQMMLKKGGQIDQFDFHTQELPKHGIHPMKPAIPPIFIGGREFAPFMGFAPFTDNMLHQQVTIHYHGVVEQLKNPRGGIRVRRIFPPHQITGELVDYDEESVTVEDNPRIPLYLITRMEF